MSLLIWFVLNVRVVWDLRSDVLEWVVVLQQYVERQRRKSQYLIRIATDLIIHFPLLQLACSQIMAMLDEVWLAQEFPFDLLLEALILVS